MFEGLSGANTDKEGMTRILVPNLGKILVCGRCLKYCVLVFSGRGGPGGRGRGGWGGNQGGGGGWGGPRGGGGGGGRGGRGGNNATANAVNLLVGLSNML